MLTDPKMYLPYGTHLIIDISGCDARELDDLEYLKGVMVDAAKASDMHIVTTAEKKFIPVGVSVILLLEESHMSIHTYPLFGAAMLDIFTCGEKDALKAFAVIVKRIRHEYVILNKMSRGVK